MATKTVTAAKSAVSGNRSRKSAGAANVAEKAPQGRQAEFEFSRLVNGFDAKLRELDENLTAVLKRLAV